MAARAFITGFSGTVLTPQERAFLREAAPWGVIIFKRNIDTPDQVRRLVDAFSRRGRQSMRRYWSIRRVAACSASVRRIGRPIRPAPSTGGSTSVIAATGLAAARLGARLIASDLRELGIDVDCLPLADVPVAGADAVIGDRAYGETPEQVAAIAGAVAAGLMEGGVLPVLKHLPGHGRATADSHQRLPVVDTDRATLEATDFAAFRPLAGLPLGMTAHVVFSAYDPLAPATTSVTMVRQVIRGSIGFRGLLMSDDVSMGALSGSIAERTRASLAAGCDRCPPLQRRARRNARGRRRGAALAGRGPRARRGRARRRAMSRASCDLAEARETFASLLAGDRPAAARMAS